MDHSFSHNFVEIILSLICSLLRVFKEFEMYMISFSYSIKLFGMYWKYLDRGRNTFKYNINDCICVFILHLYYSLNDL